MMLYFLFTLLFSISVYADQAWDDIRFKGLEAGKNYNIASGSGFFVNNDTIITNRHVVSNCQNIAIRGAVTSQLASLYLIDTDVDLAVLKIDSDNYPSRIAYFRKNVGSIREGDILFSVGYPLESSQTGVFVIKDAKVISIKPYPNTSFTQIEFTDSVNHGNSGGPLLDKNSNLVGVVTAKLTYINADAAIPTNIVSMAIGLDGLIDFLNKNHINHSLRSTYDIFINYDVGKLVKDYIVNIHCVQNTN